MKLEKEEVKGLIGRIGPSLGYDYTSVVFPEKRENVCVVKRTAENGSTYGYDTIYVVWKDKDGKIDYDELINTSDTKDYIHIDKVFVQKNTLNVKVYSGGSYSGTSWRKSFHVDLNELNL